MFGVVVIFGAVDVIGIHYFNVFYNCYVVLMLVYKKKIITKSSNLDFWSLLFLYLENSYTLKKKAKLILVFLTIISIISAG
jgi:hypothetical protein